MSDAVTAQLITLAQTQLGLVSWAQLRAFGVSRNFVARRLRSAEWSRLTRGVYKIGPGKCTLETREMAALLAAGEGAALSHHSAARKLRLDVPRTDLVRLTIPVNREQAPMKGVRIYRSRDLTPADLRLSWPFNVTSLGRTIVDLAAEVDDRWLRAAIDSALRQSRANLKVITTTLQGLDGGHRGAQRLRRLLTTYLGEDELRASALESLAVDLVEATGTRPHLHFWEHDCRFQAEIDFAWVDERVACMCDSYLWHSDRASFERDRANDRVLEEMGWKVSRWTWHQVNHERQEVIDTLTRHVKERRERPAPPYRYVAPRSALPLIAHATA